MLMLVYAVLVVLFLICLKSMMGKKSNKWAIIRFYRPSCPACVSSQSEWDQFKYKHNLKGVFVTDVNVEKPQSMHLELMRKYNIDGVPTVVAVDDNGNYKIYQGMRTYDNYRRWAQLL